MPWRPAVLPLSSPIATPPSPQAGPEGADALSELLLDSNTSGLAGLSSLDFSANAIGDAGARQLALSLGRRGCRTDALRALSLARNDIGTDGANDLARALATNSSVTSLSLQWNKISDADALAHAAATHPSLTSLDLSWNGLGDTGLAGVGEAICARPHGCGVRGLDLGHNRFSAKSAAVVCSLVVQLDQLNISGNPLGADCVAAIILAHHAADHPAVLQADDVAVRPDTQVSMLLARLCAGEKLEMADLVAADLVKRANLALLSTARPKKVPGAAKNGHKKSAQKEGGAGSINKGCVKGEKGGGKQSARGSRQAVAYGPPPAWNRNVAVEPT